VQRFIAENFPRARKIVSSVSSLNSVAIGPGPHAYHDVDMAVLRGEFGVAENGAVWITDEHLPDRALPFITENLILLLKEEEIVHNMAEAYTRIENCSYDFGTFISGPSKTADIEQSLVLGAHGAKTMTVIFLKSH
jgi:L-lactate dehydrogenase complex protein LldG